MSRRYLALIILLLSALQASAQGNNIVTDRPDQTESSAVVGRHIFQVETGCVFSTREFEYFSGVGNIRTRDYATTLLRYGITDGIEIRLASAYTTNTYPAHSEPGQAGLQPITFGANMALIRERGILPEVAVLGHLTFPWTGSNTFAPDHTVPEFRFSFSHTLDKRFSLGYNLGMFWLGNGTQGRFLYTLVLGASVADPVNVFAEFYGQSPGERFVDAGITILLTPDLQLDGSYGTNLQMPAEMHFFNTGVSFRFGAGNASRRGS